MFGSEPSHRKPEKLSSFYLLDASPLGDYIPELQSDLHRNTQYTDQQRIFILETTVRSLKAALSRIEKRLSKHE